MESVFLLRKDSHELRMRKMAEEILENGLSEHAARVRYQIKSIGTVRKWVRTLEDEKLLMAGNSSSKPKPPGVVQKLQQHTEDLTARLGQLEAALKEADIKGLYYEQIVRTAEKELGIDIEKKSATR
jgi:transposase